MDNTNGSQDTNGPIANPRDNWWYRLVGYAKRKRDERETKKKKESPTDRAARITAKATVWIAVFTVVLAVVGGITLFEVMEGGSDTHDLALAAKTQAERMKSMSDAADKIRQAAQDMVIQDQRIADNAQKTLTATVHQSEVAQRAWLDVTVEVHIPPTGIEVGKPFDIRVTTKNVGRTPTIRTRMTIRRDLVPQTSPTLTLPSFSRKSEKWVTVSSIQPDEPTFTDDILTNKLTQADFDGFMSGRIKIFLWGRFEFEDVFGRPHWINFCRYLLTGGAFSSCPVHNDEDTEEESAAKPLLKPN